MSSIYDPLGVAGPFLIRGKKILQEITAEKKDWDEEVSAYHRKQWDAWKVEVCRLQNMYVPRCYTPDEFGESLPRTLHCFSDAAEIGSSFISS